MSERRPDAWRLDIRAVRGTLRALAAPGGDSLGLLSVGEDLVGLLSESPEDLPMVAFSPFAALPGGAGATMARKTEEKLPRAGRAPGVPPTPGRKNAPGVDARPGTGTASAPVFPLKRGDARGTGRVEAVEARAGRSALLRPTLPPGAGPTAHAGAPPHPGRPRGAAPTDALPGSDRRPRVLSLSDLLSLKTDEPAGALSWDRPGKRDGGSVPAGETREGRDPVWGDSDPFADRAVLAGDRPAPTRDALASTELDRPSPPRVSSLADLLALDPDEPVGEGSRKRSGREGDGPAPVEKAFPTGRDLSAGRDPQAGRDPHPGEPHGTALTNPGGPAGRGEGSPFAAEALVDLVNEALIEQARRHGVDLS